MANVSVTYTFSNGTTADADEVNQNFTDIVNGTLDGTKDYSIAALTVAGAASLNGNVTLGNASTDDITFTGSIASSIAVKTTATYDIGGSTTGLAGIYFGANSQTVRVVPSGSMSETYTLTLPPSGGTAGYGLESDGSGTLTYKPMQTDTSAKSADYTVLDDDGIKTILMTTGASDRTVTLPTASANSGRSITVMKVDSGAGKCTIDGEGSETINGVATCDLYTQYDRVTVVCDGSEWFRVESEWGEYDISSLVTYSAGFGTISDEKIVMQRDGKFANIYGEFTGGTVTSDQAYLVLDSSLTIDMTNVTTTSSGQQRRVGSYTMLEAGTTRKVNSGGEGTVFLAQSQNQRIYFTDEVSNTRHATIAVNSVFSSNDGVSFFCRVPIADWA